MTWNENKKIAEHLPWDAAYRKPLGAVRCGKHVTLTLRLYAPVQRASLRLWYNEKEHFIVASSIERHEEYADIKFLIDTSEYLGIVWYYFVIYAMEERVFLGVDGVFDTEPRSFSLVVYASDFTTPNWFCEGLVYQIFPDRFNKSNDNTAKNGSAYHQSIGRDIIMHDDWNEDPLYTPALGHKDYLPCDFYGGTLAGIQEKLPYLKELGVTCLYLNPIFEAASNHRYNTADYMRIDPMLGDEASLTALVNAAKSFGMRIMLDGVFSHTGDDSMYFNRYARYGSMGAYQNAASPYREWYSFESYPDKYSCWWGFRSLPEVDETNLSYVAFIEQVITKWAKFGLTSWRLDVADELPDSFIAHIKSVIKAIDPSGVLIGEVWENAATKTDAAGIRRRYVDGNELDGVMNYVFRDAVIAFMCDRISAYECADMLNSLISDYPEPFLKAQMNMLGSHDTQRIITVLGGAPGRDELTREAQAKFVLSPEALSLGKTRYLAALTLQLTYIGVPCIYYGDEVGATGMADPFCRKTFPWEHEDLLLLDAVKRLTNARKNSIAMKHGGCCVCAANDNVLAIIRYFEKDIVLSVVNKSEQSASITISSDMFTCGRYAADLPSICGNYKDILTNDKVFFSQDGQLTLTIAPCTGLLLTEAK